MKKHLLYLRYIVIHKWFVMLACFKRARHCPSLIWRGIVHDLSKLRPSEWSPYVEAFNGRGAILRAKRKASHLNPKELAEAEKIQAAFDAAWLKHQRRNPHHWQYWVLQEDSGAIKELEMPLADMLEMLADWEGAGRAITGKAGTTPDWYERNRDKIRLHWRTRRLVDDALGYIEVPF